MQRSDALVVLVDDVDAEPMPARPKTRAECELPHGMRPCPFVGCRHHMLGLELQGVAVATGRHVLQFGADGNIDAYVDELVEQLAHRPSCALDLLDKSPDGLTLEEVGNAFRVTRERIRQVEAKALRKLPKRVRAALSIGREDLRPGAPAQQGDPDPLRGLNLRRPRPKP